MLTRQRWIGVVLVLVVVSAFTFERDRAESVAVVVKVTGKVEVQRGNGKPLPAAAGLALQAGDKVVVQTGDKVIVMYKTGQMQTVAQSLTIAEPERKETGSLYTRTVSTITQVASTDAARQPNRQGMIRPVEGSPGAISPRNAIVILDVRPTLVWFKLPAASDYMVQLQRTDIAGLKPVRFQARSDTSWSYPTSAPPLIPGATYEWTVAAKGSRVAKTEKFRVITGDQFSRIATLMEDLQSAGIDPWTDGLFILSLAYRDAGLMYEANSALARMAASGDGIGKVYHLLRGEVLDALGDLEGASREFKAADTENGA
ncbi:MAG: hypothetical protein ABIV28_02595 [Longimicrobiales bacterium]